jgi:hypothetical protein
VLWASVIAPILFTCVYLVEGATQPGYEPLRHQVSLLSLGSGGRVQVATFLVTGTLLTCFAVALRTALGGGKGAVGGPNAIAVSALGFVVAGLFSTQPLFGYPPGTPEDMATVITPASMLHVTGAVLLFFGLVAATAILGRRWWREGSRGWAGASFSACAVMFVCFGASGGGPSGQLLFPEAAGLLQRISLTAGLGWVLAVAVREIGSVARARRPA